MKATEELKEADFKALDGLVSALVSKHKELNLN
jgi:hypothetical protein